MIIISRKIKKIKKIGKFMKKLLIISLLATFLFAQNPRVYSAIGDDIYNNVEAIENLIPLSEYKADEDKIQKYVKEVKAAKEVGFKVEARDKEVKASIYLQTLRILIDSIKFCSVVLVALEHSSLIIQSSQNKKSSIRHYTLLNFWLII